MKVNKSPVKRQNFWKRFFYLSLAKKISQIVRYYDSVNQYSPLEHDDGTLFDMIRDNVPSGLLTEEKFKRNAILINGNFNYDFDIQKHLTELQENIDSKTRLIVIGYNSYLRIIYRLATYLGIKSGDYNRLSFLTRVDIENLATISGFEVVKYSPAIYLPFFLFQNWFVGKQGYIRNSDFISFFVGRDSYFKELKTQVKLSSFTFYRDTSKKRAGEYQKCN